jgi:prephenate dehydratase/prephenate dehydrogenase
VVADSVSFPPATRPIRLVVVGAAAGIGRWLGEHVLARVPWQAVALIDASEAVLSFPHVYDDGALRIHTPGDATSATAAALTQPGTVCVLGVPLARLRAVCGWVLPLLLPDAVVVDLSHDRVHSGDIIRSIRPDTTLVGLHCLFGINAESAEGQIFALCPDPVHAAAHDWLREILESEGGTVNELTEQRHDEVMRYVQTASHQALLTFASAISRSGLDLERDLWANRTPVFELLLALASRVLSPGQEATTASIQLADTESVVATKLDEARNRLAEAKAQGDASLVEWFEEIRAPFPGALFAKIQQAGALATSAVQSTRARLAQQRRTGELVAVRSVVGGDRLHVGRVVAATPTGFTLENLLVGQTGRGALLVDDAAKANAKELGIGGKPSRVEFSLSRVQLLSAAELETTLDQHLATVARGCKFLVPESISGESATRVVESVPHVVGATLLSAEVRLGQRECVVRFRTRIDRNVADVERAIQQRIDDVFVWPDGVVLPLTAPSNALSTLTIGFLGPSKTFSDIAGRQLARLIGAPDAERLEFPTFPEVVGALESRVADLVVLPITNSSSGLVDLAAGVLLAAHPTVTAGGVVDVPVRFDAYVARGTEIQPGSEVLSHPQGFLQCSAFIAAHQLVEVPCTSTAEACARVKETGRGVALAAAGLDDELGLSLGRASVGNLAGALTRFLVLGLEGAFAPPPRSDAILRSVWIGDHSLVRLLDSTQTGRFDEILQAPSGRTLLVSTVSPGDQSDTHGARLVGFIPWSPRTPLVVV